MYSISAQVYGEAARLVSQKSEGESYISGVIEFSADGIDCLLRLSAIICREDGAEQFHDQKAPDAQTPKPIRDIVPVWWEFHTSRNGHEVRNDFSFGELRTLLKARNA